MTSANQSQINRLTKEIADLRKAEARETAKEANIQAKISRAQAAASRTNNLSTSQSKLKEIERASKDLANVQKKRAEISGKIADKFRSLSSYEVKQARESEKRRKKIADEQRRLIREREEHERRVTSEIQHRATLLHGTNLPAPAQGTDYDFFISHATEDKNDFVRELAERLRARGAKVWYDEFTLKVGDSLRRNIDQGLAHSRFGVVVLSKYFFAKEWTQKELDGLFSLEAEDDIRILPIWHEISKDEVARQSPMLADKIALNTSLKSTEEIASELLQLD